jgi:hypothetical protein
MGTVNIEGVRPVTYYIDDRIQKNLQNKVILQLEKKDKDCVICIDGAEGSGKSTFGFQLGRFVDPSLDLSRVTFNPEEFREAIFKAKKGQCVIYDEAFTGFSSRSSLSGINRVLVSLMMQIRQKNLFVIVVLPTFFLLDKYVALFRTKVLIHVYETGGRRGYFKLYNRKLKKLLYLFGKQTYSYVPKKVFTKFKGRFYGVFALGDEEVEKKYRIKKNKALLDSEKNPMSAGQIKYREQRDVFIYLLRKQTKFTYREISNLLMDYDIELNYAQIRNICVKFGDKDDKDVDKNGKPIEKSKNDEENNDNTPLIENTDENSPKDEDLLLN